MISDHADDSGEDISCKGLKYTLIGNSWGQHGAYPGPTGPRWVPCWPHEPCYLGNHRLRIKMGSFAFLTYRYLQCYTGVSGMMTSLNGNIFRVTGHLWVESTGDWWIPLTKASKADLWCFLWSAPEKDGWATIETPRIWRSLWRHCNGIHTCSRYARTQLSHIQACDIRSYLSISTHCPISSQCPVLVAPGHAALDCSHSRDCSFTELPM